MRVRFLTRRHGDTEEVGDGFSHGGTEKERGDLRMEDSGRLNEISADIVDAAIGIHRRFGPGMLESAYELILVAELKHRGHVVRSQVPISFEYNGQKIENAFRIDVLVDEAVVVELKATETFSPVHARQLNTYLTLTGHTLGLLLNFGMEYMKNGIKRVANGDVPDIKNSTLRVSVPPCEILSGRRGESLTRSHGDTEGETI